MSVAIAIVTAVLLGGCSDNRMTVVPVEGQITLDGGGWGRPGVIYFAPVQPAEGFPRLPGIGDVGTDGNFFATTQPDRVGLVPGTYKVTVEIWEVPPTMGGPPPKSYVPKRYQNAATSDLELVVPADAKEAVKVTWDISAA